MEYGGSATITNRGALRLCTSVKTSWNSVFECINRALLLKNSITTFSKNDIELDGLIVNEDNEDTSDGEAGRIREEMVHTTHPHSLLFSSILFSS